MTMSIKQLVESYIRDGYGYEGLKEEVKTWREPEEALKCVGSHVTVEVVRPSGIVGYFDGGHKILSIVPHQLKLDSESYSENMSLGCIMFADMDTLGVVD